MSTIPFLNTKTFNDICRLCLKTGSVFMIDEIDCEGNKLKKVLNQWICFDEMGEKILPQKVCKSCIKWAYNTDYFLKQIQRNQEILQYSLSYELSPAPENKEKVKQENMIVFEFKESNKDVVINYYCKAEDNLFDLEETNKNSDYGEDNISSFSHISSLKTNAEKSTSTLSPTVANNEDVEERSQEIKVKSQLHLDCFNYFCGACEHGFKTSDELLLHKKMIRSHVNGGCIFVCHPCKLKTKQRVRFESHMDRHQNIKSYQCSTCGKSFRALGDLRRHNNKIHLNIKKFKCKFCYKIFAKKESCDEHEKDHKNISYVCSFCGISFKIWMQWFTHERVHKRNLSSKIRKRVPSNNKAIKTPCDLCNEMFPSKAKMLTHRISVHKENHFVCQTCGHKVKSFEAFDIHLKTHKDLREFHLCNYCGKSFIDVKWYRCHLKLHTNETKYKCPHCHKPCINKRALTEHLRVHTGEKLQKCNICPKVFASSKNLKLHLKTHAGPPTIKCALCPRAFYMNFMLLRHIKKQHTGRKKPVEIVEIYDSDSNDLSSGSA